MQNSCQKKNCRKNSLIFLMMNKLGAIKAITVRRLFDASKILRKTSAFSDECIIKRFSPRSRLTKRRVGLLSFFLFMGDLSLAELQRWISGIIIYVFANKCPIRSRSQKAQSRQATLHNGGIKEQFSRVVSCHEAHSTTRYLNFRALPKSAWFYSVRRNHLEFFEISGIMGSNFLRI